MYANVLTKWSLACQIDPLQRHRTNYEFTIYSLMIFMLTMLKSIHLHFLSIHINYYYYYLIKMLFSATAMLNPFVHFLVSAGV